MIKLHARLFGLVLLALPFFSPAPAVALTLSEKAAIQAFMQRHVDGKLIDGALLYLNQKTDEVQRLHPVTAHPMTTAAKPFLSTITLRAGTASMWFSTPPLPNGHC